jgi:hypothetical protein
MEVSKRVQEKLATISAKEPGEISAGEEQVQQQINQVKQQALSEKTEAVQKAVEETTQRLTAEFTKSQAESAEKLKAELASSGFNPSNTVPEDLVEARVSSKIAEIKTELQAAAAAREQELVRKHQAELSEARKAPTQNPDLKQPTPEQLQEITKVAVEIAVKSKEAELLQLHKSSAEAMVETTKAKVMAEMNSKHNVVQMQLKRSHLKNAELTAKINELSAQLNGTTPPTSVAPATATPATPLAPTASAFVPTGTPDASSSQPTANAAPSAQTAPGTTQSNQTGATPNSADPANGLGLPTRPQGPAAQVIRGGAVRGRGGSTRGALPQVGLNTFGAASQAARGMARGTTITFGRGAPRGVRGGRAGMVGRGGAPGGGGVPSAVGTAPGPSGPITAPSTTSPELPAEGRMAEKPGLTGSVSIRGAATIKKAGAGNLLGMAVKQATGTAAENASFGTPSLPSIAGQAANKRPREEDTLGSSNGSQTSNDPAQLKRAKGINNPSNNQAEESSGSVNSTPVNELAARLSKRP